MKSPVVTCSFDSDLNCAAELMWDHDCGVVPVVDADGRLAGIVTDRDVCMAAYTQGGSLRSIPVDSAMAKHVLVCHLNDSVTVAELAQLGVRRISVGGGLSRAAWTGFLQAATEIAEQGTFSGLGRAAAFADINNLFGSR